ncbi:MAG TPA: hypothetical protein VMW16_10915 [Sedimentisphaerales bacterium]|nr:hypothetical protein [Sedimentisphaerales bacterium]
MKKSIRIMGIVLAAIVVLVVVTAVIIGLFADRAVKMGVEAAGTKALNVGVRVGDAELSIMGGKVGLKNLVIDNPPGYQNKQLRKRSRGFG